MCSFEDQAQYNLSDFFFFFCQLKINVVPNKIHFRCNDLTNVAYDCNQHFCFEVKKILIFTKSFIFVSWFVPPLWAAA